MRITISPGEFFDRLTILEIKRERTSGDRQKQAKIQYEELRNVLAASGLGLAPIANLVIDLKAINGTIWALEDGTRRKEAEECWDQEFIEMARGIFHANDRRATIKRKIDEVLGSDLSEVKEYAEY